MGPRPNGGCDTNGVNSIPQYKKNTNPPSGCTQRSCPAGYVWNSDVCDCTPSQHNPSPIIIDVDGSGYQLTSASDGVTFDILADGHPIKVSWTAAGSTNAFLVLDRNGDGAINTGAELFGDHTPQPPSDDPNGFLALAVYDLPENGGNGDGKIDRNDLVWSSLRLWQDINHDGISQRSELHTLDELGVESISLRYSEQHRTDEYGNYFRYRARVESEGGHWAWDVFLVSYPLPPN